MAFLSYLDIPISGISAQRLRMDVISENIAKATTTMTEDGGPYRRQITLFGEDRTFKNINTNPRNKVSKLGFGGILNKTLEERNALKNRGVQVMAVQKQEDEDSPFTPVYDPTHPHADENGYYYLPNVDVAEEQLDLIAATHSYQNNIAVYDTLVQMTQRALSMGR